MSDRTYYDRKNGKQPPVQLTGTPREVFRVLREQGWIDPQVRQFLPESDEED